MNYAPRGSRLDTLRALHARDPADAFTCYGLAMELQKAPATEAEAVALLEKLCAESPRYLPTYLQLGMLLARRGDAEEARQVYRQGIEVAAALGDLHTREEIERALEAL